MTSQSELMRLTEENEQLRREVSHVRNEKHNMQVLMGSSHIQWPAPLGGGKNKVINLVMNDFSEVQFKESKVASHVYTEELGQPHKP